MFSDVITVASAGSQPINSAQAAVSLGNPAVQSVFSYFFQVGFGLALGIALVVVPVWRIVIKQKPLIPRLKRNKLQPGLNK